LSNIPQTFIRSRIAANSAAHTIFAGRVYQDDAPQDVAAPYMLIQRLASEEARIIAPTAGTGLHFDLMQVDVYGATRATVRAAVDAARTAIETVPAGGVAVGGSRVQLAEVQGIGADIDEAALDGGDVSIYRTSMQARIIWRE